VASRLAVAVSVAAVAAAPIGAAGPANADLTCTATKPLPAPPSVLPHYALTVRVAKGLRQADGRLSVKFTPEQATDRVVFRLWPNAPFLASKGAWLTVGNVRVGGATHPVVRSNPTTLVVKRAVATGETVVVSMTWRLHLPSGAFDRLYGGSVARLGSFFPLLAWNPAEGWLTDPPSAIGWETWTSPVADFDVKVTAPRGLQVFASGTHVAKGRWQAHAVRDFALAVGRFTVVRGTAAAPGRVRLIVAVERRRLASARRFLAWTQAALESHARRVGPYPWRTFTLVGMDMDHFSYEYPTLVFESTSSPTPPRSDVAHELAHQWFYSLVGNNQARDPWLDEALATWGATRFSHTLPQVLTSPLPDPVRNQLGQPMSFWDSFEIGVFVDGVYTQGVQALASLGGPEAVDCALRLYATDNAYEIAEPRDLLRALEAFFPDARQKLEAYGARF
jgi:Peptidase family M1 domain